MKEHDRVDIQPQQPVTFHETSILTIEQVADWLQISVRLVERLDIPCVYLGRRTRRYIGKVVLDHLEKNVA